MKLDDVLHNLKGLKEWGELDQEFTVSLGIALEHLYKIKDENSYCDNCGEVLNVEGKCPWACEEDEQENEVTDEDLEEIFNIIRNGKKKLEEGH